MSNKKRKQIIFFLQQQTIKIKYYEKIINIIENLAFIKLDKALLFIKISINLCNSVFIYVLSLLVNKQLLSKS